LSAADYAIDLLLIAVIFRQVRPRPVTALTAAAPLVLVALAAAHFLRGFPTAGNDIQLFGILAAAGAALGGLSASATTVWRETDGAVLARAGVAAVAAWILGMGFRLAFAMYAHSSTGSLTLARFSARHSITRGAWATALVLMAIAEVTTRVVAVHARGARAGTASASPRTVPAVDATG
jgi:hypothetical protein